MSGLSDQARAVLARLQDAPADKDALADHVGVAASTVRDHIATLRDEYDAADAGDLDAETQDRAEDDESDDSDTDGFGMTGAMN